MCCIYIYKHTILTYWVYFCRDSKLVVAGWRLWHERQRGVVKNDKHYWNWQIKLYWTENIRLTNKSKHIFNIWYNQKVKNFYCPNETFPSRVTYNSHLTFRVINAAKTKELFNKTNLYFVFYYSLTFKSIID